MTDGHGWSGANIVFWNCSAEKIDVGKPPTAQNWAIGDTTTATPAPTGTGFIESSNNPVTPASLYHAQLEDRLARDFAVSDLVRITAKPVLSLGSTFAVTITNISNVKIGGPVLLVFTSLPRGVALASVSGLTSAGDPFVAMNSAGLAPGQSATAMVRFTASPPAHGIAVEVLAGLPQELSRGGNVTITQTVNVEVLAGLPQELSPPPPTGGVFAPPLSGLDSLFADWAPDQPASLTSLDATHTS